MLLPFDAVNLSAVDISILKIYENNIPQFFQDNDLAGHNDLRRVAKAIVQKTLGLDDDKTLDLHVKQRFSLDIEIGGDKRKTIFSATHNMLPQKSSGAWMIGS